MSEVSRRQLIKVGAAGVGVWAVPTVLVMAAGPASADVASGSPHPTTPGEPVDTGTTPPTDTGTTPPTDTGTTPPTDTGTTPPTDTGTTPPVDTGTTPPGAVPTVPTTPGGAAAPWGTTAPSETSPAVAGAPLRGELARTGVDAGVVAAAGLGLMAAGAAAVKFTASDDDSGRHSA